MISTGVFCSIHLNCAPLDSFREEDPTEVNFLPVGPFFGIILNF